MCYALPMTSDQWKELLASMPPGLTFDELAARISVTPSCAFKQAKIHGYALGDGHTLQWNMFRVKKGLETRWRKIDWTKGDSELGRKYKRSRQWFFQLRRKRTAIRVGKRNRKKTINNALDKKEAAA